MKLYIGFLVSILFASINACVVSAQANTAGAPSQTEIIPVAKGWARNSVNTVIFRQNSVTTYKNTQYTAFYNRKGWMVLAKRTLGNKDWKIHKTQYKANVRDAHNSISIAIDGNGILHVSWGMHGQKLNYARGKSPGSLKLSKKLSMTGKDEAAVTYPRFYRLLDGDLLFMYREGESGKGNVMLNRYDVLSENWYVVAHSLIDGEGERNGYMNTVAIDENGGWHFSWTWRESPDVATNHDIMYAYSPDEGKNWMKSDGDSYTLPITMGNAEIIYRIPQGSDLINNTSMTIDSEGDPVIATYWRSKNDNCSQYHLILKEDDQWKVRQVGERETPFSLSGSGTKRIPISRPQIVAGMKHDLYIIYRDFERGGGITVARSDDPEYEYWTIKEIYSASVKMWEPTLDPQAWKKYHELYLFVQSVGQGDAETLQDIEPQKIFILKWSPMSHAIRHD